MLTECSSSWFPKRFDTYYCHEKEETKEPDKPRRKRRNR